MRGWEWEFEMTWIVETPKHENLRICLIAEYIAEYEYLYNACMEDTSSNWK